MGVILPFYSLIDMLESAINVWSDASVTAAVDKDLKAKRESPSSLLSRFKVLGFKNY